MAQAIQQSGNARVIELASQLLNQLLYVRRCCPPMLPDAILRNTQRSVVTSLPMNNHLNFDIIHADDDLLNDRAQNALANLVARCRTVPSQGQIGS